jgi:hypothetical protein
MGGIHLPKRGMIVPRHSDGGDIDMNFKALSTDDLRLLCSCLEWFMKFEVKLDKLIQSLKRILKTREVAQKAVVERLAGEIEGQGESSILDDMVDDEASTIGTDVNNGGISRQLTWLLDRGYSQERIMNMMGIAAVLSKEPKDGNGSVFGLYHHYGYQVMDFGESGEPLFKSGNYPHAPETFCSIFEPGVDSLDELRKKCEARTREIAIERGAEYGGLSYYPAAESEYFFLEGNKVDDAKRAIAEKQSAMEGIL